MPFEKFDVSKLERLNDPGRFESLDPELMWHALGDPAPKTIVEIGAGTGLFAARFARMASGSVVYAVDSHPKMVAWMTENRPEVADGRLVPVRSSETGVPLATGIADLVVMINVHHELADPDATYYEALRLLARGGQMLLVDWAPIDTPKGPPQRIRASSETLTATLQHAGFCDIEVHTGLPWHSLLTAHRPDPRSVGDPCATTAT